MGKTKYVLNQAHKAPHTIIFLAAAKKLQAHCCKNPLLPFCCAIIEPLFAFKCYLNNISVLSIIYFECSLGDCETKQYKSIHGDLIVWCNSLISQILKF